LAEQSITGRDAPDVVPLCYSGAIMLHRISIATFFEAQRGNARGVVLG